MVSPHPQATKKVSLLDNNLQLNVVYLLGKEEEVKKTSYNTKNNHPRKKPLEMTGNDASTRFYDAILKPRPSFVHLTNMMAEFQKGRLKLKSIMKKKGWKSRSTFKTKKSVVEYHLLLEERS